MIATINGITVMGSPEEIKRFQELTANTNTSVRQPTTSGGCVSTSVNNPNITVTASADINKIANELNKRFKAETRTKAWSMI